MQSIFDQGSPDPCPSSFNMAAYVLRHAASRAAHPALTIAGPTTEETLNYKELEAKIRGAASGLLSAGVQPGDFLLLQLGNIVDVPIAYLAAIAVGIIPVPTSSQLTPPEVQKICDDLDPAAILRAPDIVGVPNQREIDLATFRSWQDLPPCTYAMGDPDRLAYVVYTSGTSGTPRAVAHAHRAIWARRMMIQDWYDLKATDRMMHAGAFNWTYTMGTGLMDPWSVGATALIPDAGVDISQLPDLLVTQRASLFAAVPGVYRKLLNSPKLPDFPCLRHGLSAGEKLSPEIFDAWKTGTGTRIFEAFGMSECSTFVCSGPSRMSPITTLGQPQLGRRVAVVDDVGPVPVDHPGILAVHRSDPGLMIEYFGSPDATQQRYVGDWFLTGDQVSMSNDGHITYLGRADDMMNTGGFRVSPLEVEAVLAQHPDVTQIAVTSVSPKPGVQIIAAFYCSAKSLDEDALMAFANSRLARYKQPRTYRRVDHLPTEPNGKIKRRALAQNFKG